MKNGDREFRRELCAIALPVGLQSLLTALVGASDALMLGRFTQEAVAAVSLANQIAFVMSLFHMAIVGGGGALMAQYWGKGDRRMVKNLLCMNMKWNMGVSAVFFAAAMFCPRLLMRLYTPDAELIRIGADYLRAVSFSYLFIGATQCYYMVMKIEGRAAKGVLISAVTLIADVVIDWFLIYGRAGMPKLGATGSAYSTVIVEAIALIWAIAESHRGDSVRPDVQGFLWRSHDVTSDFVKIAAPMFGSCMAWGLSITVHAFIMGHHGADATAAASIAGIAQELVTCVCKGISAGAGVMVGKLLGQDLFDRAKAYGSRFLRVSIAVGAVHMLLLCAIGPIVTRYFVLTDAARRDLTSMLVFSGLYVFAYSINTIIVCGVFPAGGDARYDAVSVAIASWCFAIPLALIATFALHLPAVVVYIVMCSDEIVKLPWLYPRYKKFIWLKNLTREDQT